MATKDTEIQKPQQGPIPDNTYPMYLPRMGICIIINNLASTMTASQHDVVALQEAYKQVGFEVYCYKDCTAKEMQRINAWVLAKESHMYSNCLAYNIISYESDTGELLDANKRRAFSVHKLVDDLSQVESLQNKPRLIVAQTCREADSDTVLPKKEDFFIACNSIQGLSFDSIQGAYSDKDGGSLYLQYLAEHLKNEYMKNSVDKIFLMVRESVKYKTGLTDKVLMDMAGKIASNNMEAIALGYLDIDGAVVKRLSHSRREDKLMFNYDVLEMWRNRNTRKKNTRERLNELLLQAADEGAYVNSDDVATVLQVQPESFREQSVEVNSLTHILHFADFQRNAMMIPGANGGTVISLEKEIHRIKSELGNYSGENASSRTANGKSSEQYEQDIKALREEVKKLKETDGEAKETLSEKIETMTKEKEKVALEEQLRKHEQELYRLKEEMKKNPLDEEMAAHQEEIQRLKKENERIKEELEASDLQKFEEQIESLTRETAEYQEKYEAKMKKLQELQRQREAEQEKIRNQKEAAKQSAQRLQSLYEEETNDPQVTLPLATASAVSTDTPPGVSPTEQTNDPEMPLSLATPSAVTTDTPPGVSPTAQMVRHVEMTLLSTHDTNLWDWGNMTVMPETGDVAVLGKRKKGDPMSLFIYRRKEEGTWREMEVTPPCGHYEGVRLLGVPVEGQELLAISCGNCAKIRLFNLDTRQVTTAYKRKNKKNVGIMCHGDAKRLYVKLDRQNVRELNCSRRSFSKIKTVIRKTIDGYYGMCFVPSPCRYIVVRREDKIRAISCDTNKIVWTVEGEVDGKKVHPLGLLFFPHNSLLVCDWDNSRILILDPSNGSCRQTLNLPEMGQIYGVQLYKNQIIMRHVAHNKLRISYFSYK